MDKNTTQHTLTRRAALRLGASIIVPLVGRAAALGGGDLRQPDLFVFKAPKMDRLVMAVAFGNAGNAVRVQIHANKKSWTLDSVGSAPGGETPQRGEDRFFAGNVLIQGSRLREMRSVAVIETPFSSFGERNSIGAWAEILTQKGSRLRVGNPLLTKALALDPVLTARYHSARPEDDRLVLETALAHRLAMFAAAGGVADPAAHGRRLAALLLPDIIKYHPALPVGFTFASQNGRHPADNTAAVIDTILTGAPARRCTSNAWQLTAAFPYFQIAALG